MHSNKKKIIGAVAVAGIIAAGGSAFTAGGLGKSGQAALDEFVGGSVIQTITGATLLTTAYTVEDSVVTAIDLTFDDAANGKTLLVKFGTTEYECDAIVLGSTNCTGDAPSGSGDLSVTVTEPVVQP